MMNRRSTSIDIFQSALYSSNVVWAVIELMRWVACWMSHKKDLGSRRIDRLPGLVDGFSEVWVFDGGVVHEIDFSVE